MPPALQMARIRNDILLRTIGGISCDRPPVWLMRQAGRILPEYRAVRSRVKDFQTLVQTPELAAEVTVQPVDILDVDAAIIFSDILVIPEAMGMPYRMEKGIGPVIEDTLKQEDDLNRIHTADPGASLKYVTDAISIAVKALDGRVPLIGFSGAPWTLFCYMVEGRGSKTFSAARRMLYEAPELSRKVFDMLSDSIIAYLHAQVHAGADMVQIFDSWAGVLTHEQFKRFTIPALQRICRAMGNTPVTVFAKGAWFALDDLSELDCECIGLDWNMDPAAARRICGDKVLQGNLDPAVLYADEQTIEEATKKMLANFGSGKHIANLGHGVYPDTDPRKVKCFIDTVKNQ